MMEREKVEFIESYIKVQGGDYQWSDNHGELIRCKNCKHGEPFNEDVFCTKDIGTIESCVHKPEWFCADGERKE